MIKLALIAVSILCGLIFLFQLDVSLPSIRRKKSEQRNRRIRLRRVAEFRQKVTLMLMNINSRRSVDNYFNMIKLLALTGFLFGTLLVKNPFLGMVLAVGLPFLQYLILYKKNHDRVRYHNGKLEIYMSLVTNSYLRSGSIDEAVFSSYGRMDTAEAAVKPFEFFIAQSTSNTDTEQCIQGMKKQYNNKHFQQWCDILTLCVKNSRLKFVLPFIVKRMRRSRTLDNETETACYKSYRDFIFVCLMTVLVTFLIPMQIPAWKYVILSTAAGMIGLTMVILVVLFSAAYVVKVTSRGGDAS